MLCRRCEGPIEPDVDRHLVPTERFVAPTGASRAKDGGAFCAEWMESRRATLAPPRQ